MDFSYLHGTAWCGVSGHHGRGQRLHGVGSPQTPPAGSTSAENQVPPHSSSWNQWYPKCSLSNVFLVFYSIDSLLSLIIGSNLATQSTVTNAQDLLTLGYAVLNPLILIHREGKLIHFWVTCGAQRHWDFSVEFINMKHFLIFCGLCETNHIKLAYTNKISFSDNCAWVLQS